MKKKKQPNFRYRDGLTGRFISAKRAKKLSRKRVTKVEIG